MKQRRRPDLYTDIPVPVLQVPAGEDVGPGGLPNLMKQWEQERMGRRRMRMISSIYSFKQNTVFFKVLLLLLFLSLHVRFVEENIS